MKIEYDPQKNERNLRERGLSFERAAAFDLSRPSRSRTRGGIMEKFAIYPWIGGELHALVFTLRDDAVRVISLRRVNRKERRLYAERTGSGND